MISETIGSLPWWSWVVLTALCIGAVVAILSDDLW